MSIPVTIKNIYNGWKLFLERKVIFSVCGCEWPDTVSRTIAILCVGFKAGTGKLVF